MAKIHIRTYGCSANTHEAEAMAGLLANEGNAATITCDSENSGDEISADIIIANVCTVKGDNKALREIRRIKEKYPDKKLIISGCVTSQMLPIIKNNFPGTAIVNTDNITDIVEAKNKLLEGKIVEIVSRKQEVKIKLPKIRKNPAVSIVPISDGCSQVCTYCSVRQVKGKLHSYPVEKIISEVENSVDDGCREIWLTSQDNGAYMTDAEKESTLPELIEKICSIEGNFKVRIGMINPTHINENNLQKFIEAFKHEKVFKFLHLCVQSGNNDILKKMVRWYTVEQFEGIVNEFRKHIPEITVSTDIICGFPSETMEQFMDSVELVKRIKPNALNISRFHARPETAAARMKQDVHGNESKNRSQILTKEFEKMALERNRKWIGWKGKILIDEIGKNNTMVGRNYCYKPVVIEGKISDYPFGTEIDVEVVDAFTYWLKGRVV
ncbi:MAG TPA: tRNA (N(6)-L-threonylcarbamoyladenosine(37)-C(2))-methylthiotransferase [Candidatus Nanoarchaeia archaeon]|nr:tRNA (N(6)-L-threonylcarbamoyladenosine(37)-C(2))-methylthiotransferase [Candidatus Nanoarchaeia archaeon]